MKMLLKHKNKLLAAALLLAVLAAFGATLRLGFIWDDHQFIEANPYIKSWTPANLRHAFTSDPFNQALNYYRPLQTVSDMLDFSIWRLNPFGYHLTNLLFHAASSLLVFVLAGDLGLGFAAAFLAALFFAVNPTGIEQLIIVAGRAELATTAFTLASVLLFLRRKYVWAFSAFLAALGFKENGIVAPFLTALSLWYLGRDRKEYFKLAAFLLPVPFYLWLRHSATGGGVLETGAGVFLLQAAEKLPAAVLVYLKNAFLPLNMHSHRMQPDFAPWFYAAYAAWALAAAALVKYKPRAALFVAGWYFINLAPKAPLLAGNDLMLEHWTYLANLGLYAGAAALLAGWLEKGGVKKNAALACACALPLFWIADANVNIGLRSTDLKIYEHAARYSRSKPMLYNLAREYYLSGQFERSRAILARISALDPGSLMYRNGLALSLWKTGDVKGALALMDGVLAQEPGNGEALFNKACVLLEKKDLPAAEALLKRAVAAAPGGEPAYAALAGLYLGRGKDAAALEVYGALLRLDPYNLEALNNSGIINAKNGRYAAAEKLFMKASRMDTGPNAARNLERVRRLEKSAGQ